MVCPNCGSNNCGIINETNTSGKDYSAGKGCLGYLMFGGPGLLCGLCGEGRQTHSTNFWLCYNCGRKWKA